MSRDVKVGILIEVKDAASAGIKAIGDGMKGASEGAKKGFSVAAETIRTLDHAANLAHRSFAMLNSTFGESIRASLDFRNKNDPTARAFRGMTNDLDILKARVGDVLLPVLIGLSKGFSAVGNSATHWLEQNRKLMGMKLVEWISVIGHGLIDGIGGAVILVARAWAGWLMIVDTVKAGLNGFFSVALDGISSVLGGAAKMASALHLSGVSESLTSAADTVSALGAEFEASKSAAVDSLLATNAGLDETERKLNAIKIAAHGAFSTAVVEAAKAVGASNQSGFLKQADTDALSQKLGKAYGMQSAYYSRLADLQEKSAIYREAQEDELFQRQAAMVTGIGEAFGSAMSDMISGSQSASKAMAKAFVTTVRTVIMAYAAEAAAAAFKAHAGIPFVGIAIGTAMAGVAFAAVEALISKASFAQGGVVTGGIANRDSVPILAMPGERVLTKEETRIYNQGGRNGAAVHVHVPVQSVFSDEAAIDRAFNQRIGPAINRMLRDGRLRIPSWAVG